MRGGFLVLLLLLVISGSYLLSGGFSKTPLKPFVTTPTPVQVIVKSKDETDKNSLQIGNLAFSTVTPIPSPTPTSAPTPTNAPTPADRCSNGDSSRSNCSCPAPASDAVMCNIATNTPSTVILGGVILRTNQTCPDSGLPCAYWDSSPAGQAIMQSWGGCRPNDCIYVKNNIEKGPLFIPSANPSYGTYASCQGGHNICWDKPVIYLYADQIMHNVSVQLQIPGSITTSIPQYPPEGWQDLTVIPGGIIQYNNESYRELFYETAVTKNEVPQSGFVFSLSNLPAKLDALITTLGLNPSEKKEFLSYWLPKLSHITKPYVFVGILTPDQKNAIDTVIVNPQPDTTIEFLTYFKGLDTPYVPVPPTLPPTPKRNGFTMVEWGGAIAN